MDFGAIREQNIKSNTALLKSLGFETPVIPPAPKKDASPKTKKRKSVRSEKDTVERPKKVAKVALEQPVDTSGRRRSSRIAAAKPKPDIVQTHIDSGHSSDEEDDSAYKNQAKLTRSSRSKVVVKSHGTEYVGNRLGKRKHNPKTFGAIPGIKVGTWWETRAECSTDAVHAPFVAGIAGSARDGAYSVALSGGYEDDVDLGYAFTYTGSGGRDLKGTKDKPKNLRTAPQSSDQTFDNTMNAALKMSVKTKRPVRVVRGYKLNSEFAPAQGYRYDGLYTVEKAWLERGLNSKGYKVCKFAFKRLPGQPPLSRQEDDNRTSEEEQEEISQHDDEEEEKEDEEEENVSDETESEDKVVSSPATKDSNGSGVVDDETPATEAGGSSEERSGSDDDQNLHDDN